MGKIIYKSVFFSSHAGYLSLPPGLVKALVSAPRLRTGAGQTFSRRGSRNRDWDWLVAGTVEV